MILRIEDLDKNIFYIDTNKISNMLIWKEVNYDIVFNECRIGVSKETFEMVLEKWTSSKNESANISKNDKELLAKVVLNTECDNETKLKIITNLFNSEEVAR